jgi:hypothetical protein
MALQPPTAQHLRRLAEAQCFELAEEELAAFQSLLPGIFTALDALDQAPSNLRNQTVIVSSQPRIESYGCQNWHPERLSQPRVPETDHGSSRESPFARLAQPRSDANVAGQCLQRYENEQDRLIPQSDRLPFAHRHCGCS